jgi:hypothetical protein
VRGTVKCNQVHGDNRAGSALDNAPSDSLCLRHCSDSNLNLGARGKGSSGGPHGGCLQQGGGRRALRHTPEGGLTAQVGRGGGGQGEAR